MWQSLSFKPNYKAAYCLAVCPAGEEVVEPYLDDRKGFIDLVLKPLQDKKETLYVLPNSAAKAHAERCYPHRRVEARRQRSQRALGITRVRRPPRGERSLPRDRQRWRRFRRVWSFGRPPHGLA